MRPAGPKHRDCLAPHTSCSLQPLHSALSSQGTSCAPSCAPSCAQPLWGAGMAALGVFRALLSQLLLSLPKQNFCTNPTQGWPAHQGGKWKLKFQMFRSSLKNPNQKPNANPKKPNPSLETKNNPLASRTEGRPCWVCVACISLSVCPGRMFP